MVTLPNSSLPKLGIEPLINTRRLLILSLYYAQIRTSDTLMLDFVHGPIYKKLRFYCHIQTQYNGQTPAVQKLNLLTQLWPQTQLLVYILSSSHWYKRHTFLTQIFRNNYYQTTDRSLKPRHKNGLSSLPTRSI